MTDPIDRRDNIEWIQSSFTDGVQCVEVAEIDGLVVLRDDTDPDRTVAMTPGSFDAFAKGVEAGEFNRFRS